MSRDLRPTDGARFLLELGTVAGALATYRVVIFTPEAAYETTATLADDGAVTMPATGAPGDLDVAIEKLAKLVARDASRRRSEGLPAWPARILRWRR